jgi:hypothetical protein
LTNETCDEFVSDFVKSRYVEEPDSKGFLKLDVRAIGEDEFYLTQAAKAGIKKSVPSTRLARLYFCGSMNKNVHIHHHALPNG